MKIKIDTHEIPNIERLKQLDAIVKAGKACELKIQMMVGVAAMKSVQVLDDDGRLVADLNTYDDVNRWIATNIADDMAQYSFVETNIYPKWAR